MLNESLGLIDRANQIKQYRPEKLSLREEYQLSLEDSKHRVEELEKMIKFLDENPKFEEFTKLMAKLR